MIYKISCCVFANGAATAAFAAIVTSVSEMGLQGGSSNSSGGSISEAEALKALEEMRGYEEFAAIEGKAGKFNLKVDNTIKTSKYDPRTNTIIIKPGDLNTEYGAIMPPGFEESLEHLSFAEWDRAIGNYPKWHRFSIQRILFHEANHSLQSASGLKYLLNPAKYEIPVIERTNKFMHEWY